MPSQFRRIDHYQLLHEQTYDSLRQAIVSGEVLPGKVLSQEQLADILGVSRTPVRDAVRRLEVEGVLKVLPNRGVMVCKYSRSDVKEIYMLRIVLEGLAANLAAQAATKKDIAVLERWHLEVEKQAETDNIDVLALGRANQGFHQSLQRAAGSPRLRQIAKMVSETFITTRSTTIILPRLAAFLQQHGGILEAVKQRNPLVAERLAKEHVRLAESLVLSDMSARGLDYVE
ncbi:MAG: GntR family transcriptional regulator [bacterium]|nr:GntR family transcriptional regulator [bacterium]